MHRSGGSHTWPQTHPNLPQGKELVTPTKWCQPTAEIVVQGNLHLPYGGEREGAEVHWLKSLADVVWKQRAP